MSGSGGSGGYEYQDNAIGYVAAHILASESLGWRLETGAPDIPVAVAAETGGPGDDLRITLQNDVIVELQAKHGLQKSKLFEPLLKLAKGLHEDPSLYGVLLTDSTASRTIRDHLRNDLINLGQDRFDSLRAITKEFQDRLVSANLPKDSSAIFCRLRIIVLDLDDDLPNAKSAQTLLLKLVSDQHQASTVWKILCDEGRSLNSNRGRRDKQLWFSLLKDHSITFINELVTNNLEQAINWTELCRKMLPTELEANPLLSGDGVTLDVEDILSLDLVERKERSKLANDPSPENFQRSLKDQEIPLPYNQLFEEVLIGCQRGKGIAIIGEAGAGKTTLLCAIAHWIIKRDELPIFVSLRNLEGKLEDYILETWLKKAISKRNASEKLQDELIEQCNAGRVWLLLDGIDEIGTSQTALSSLSQELKEGWLSSNRIAITCRVNIWDASRNDLETNFQCFRSRGFKDEEQITFIKKFFAKAQQSETGEQLIRQLEDAPLRLKDLIKSPLWMVILCRTWKRRIGKLPETKAELYEGFVATFYDWKDKPDIPKEKRPALERALGELSKKAIDQKNFRFSLRESFIRQELDKADPSFFDMACKLGWINKLGIAPGNSEEPVYSFLHPTFQEYFAALAIDDRYFFLNHIPHSPKQGTYRIFEQCWKEVLLLWFGKTITPRNVQVELINELISFGDSCEDFFGGFYHYQAYFLAASALGECCESLPGIERVIIQTSELAFGFVDYSKKRWESFPDFLLIVARSSLKESNCIEAIKVIENLLMIMQGNDFSGNTLDDSLVLTRMVKWRIRTHVESGLLSISKFLMELDSSNQIAVDTLRKLLNCRVGLVKSGAASVLVEYGHESVEVKTTYSKALESINSLVQTMATFNFRRILEGYNSDDAHHSLHELDIASLIEQLHDSYEKQELVLIRIIDQLGEVGDSDTKVIETLIHYLLNDDNPAIIDRIYKSLEKIVTKDNFLKTVRILKNSLGNSDQSKKAFSKESLKLLWYCAQNMSYPEFHEIWHGSSSHA